MKSFVAISLLSTMLACCPTSQDTARAEVSVFRAVLRAREGDVLELQSSRGQRLQVQLQANTAIFAADGSRLAADALQSALELPALELYVRAWPQAQRWQAEEVRVLEP